MTSPDPIAGNHDAIDNKAIEVDARRKSIERLFYGQFIFLLPMLKFVEINIGGKISLSEIIILVIFMFMSVTRRMSIDSRIGRVFIILCLLWLSGQIVTDVVRDTPLIDYSRGWAKIAITIINYSALFVLLTNSRRFIAIFAAGIAAGGILGYFVHPGLLAQDYPWKFGIGAPITLILVLLVSAIPANKLFFRAIFLIFAFTMNLVFGFRSMAGICFLTLIYIVVQRVWPKGAGKTLTIGVKEIAILSAIMLAGSFIIIKAYSYAASEGILGEKARQLYNLQSYGMLGVLIGGRSEILVSTQAIKDSPLIGHGSWAKNEKYASTLIDIKRSLGYYGGQSDESGLIPTHSHLFGAWVEAGLLGAVFWIWLMVLPLRCLSCMHKTSERLVPLFAFICFNLLWDILFSPYAGDRRLITPYFVVAITAFLSNFKNNAYASNHSNNFF